MPGCVRERNSVKLRTIFYEASVFIRAPAQAAIPLNSMDMLLEDSVASILALYCQYAE